MNDDLLKAIHQELVAIRQLLADGKTTQAPRITHSSRTNTLSTTTSSGGDAPIPQPTEVVANPGEVQVHFGKNNGVPLAKLSERSLSWYAQEQAPRLDSTGNPYPARPQETLLRNAARTLWHQNRGTLGKSDETLKLPAEIFTESTAHLSDEEVLPF
jgi:hypothetical protein